MKREKVELVVGDKKSIIEVIKLSNLEKIKHNVRRYLQKQIISSKKNMTKNDYIPRSQDEKEAISICKCLIRNKRSELLLCPKTWERYVINEKLEMDIIINDRSIDIVNHTYHYNIAMCEKTHSIILNIFDGHVEKRRQELKKRIFSNVKYSLNTIYARVKEDLTKHDTEK